MILRWALHVFSGSIFWSSLRWCNIGPVGPPWSSPSHSDQCESREALQHAFLSLLVSLSPPAQMEIVLFLTPIYRATANWTISRKTEISGSEHVETLNRKCNFPANRSNQSGTTWSQVKGEIRLRVSGFKGLNIPYLIAAFSLIGNSNLWIIFS